MGTERRCPSCGTASTSASRSCPHCGTAVADPDWDALDELRGRIVGIDTQVSELLRERQSLVDEYERHRTAIYRRSPMPPAQVPATTAQPPRPRQEWSGARVRAWLLGLGAALLGISALTFTAVAWTRLDDSGRAVLLFIVTALVTGSALGLRRRLPMTAEAFAGLAVALVLVDVYATRRAGLGQEMSWQVWWAAGTATAAGFAAVLGRSVGRRTTRFAVAALLPLAPELLAGRLADTEWAAALILAALAGVVVYALGRWTGQLALESRVVLGLHAGGSWLAAACSASIAATEPASIPAAVPPALAVAALFAAPGLASRLLPDRVERIAAAVLAAGVPSGVLLTLAAPAVGYEGLLTIAVLAGTATALAAYFLPVPHRAAGVIAGAAFAVPGAMWALVISAPAVGGPLTTLADPWTGSVDSIAEVPGLSASWAAVGCLAVIAGAGFVLGTRQPWGLGIGCAAIGFAVALAPLTAGATVLVTLAATAAAFILILLAGAWIGRTRQPDRGWQLLPGAAIAAAPTVGWAAVSPAASVVTSALTALAAGGAALIARAGPARPLYAGQAVLLGVTFVGVATRAAGAGLPAAGFAAVVAAAGAMCLSVYLLRGGDPWVAAAVEMVGALTAGAGVVVASGSAPWLAGALTVLVPVAVVAARSGDGRGYYAGAAAVLALGAVWVWLDAAGVRPVAIHGFAIAVAAGAVALVGVHALRDDRVRGLAVEAVGSVGAIAGVLTAADSRPWLAGALTALAAMAAVAALRPDLRLVCGAIAGGCALGAVWAWLAAARVGVVEAYTAPAAAVALAAGIARWRSGPGRSWLRLGPALVLAVGPTLLLGVADDDVVRLVVAAVLSLAVVVAGAVWRLQAPLVLGAVALLFLAVDQWGDDIVRMPRWISLGMVGVLLMWIGATFERRRRDWRRAAAVVGRFG